MKMEEKKSSRIGFINSGDTWGDAHYLIRNVAQNEKGLYVGDIQMETGNTYLNKAGKECKEYKKIGAIRFSKDSGTLAIDEGGKVNKYSFTPTTQSNDRGNYLLLSFGEENPYMKYLDDDAEESTDNAVSDDVPF